MFTKTLKIACLMILLALPLCSEAILCSIKTPLYAKLFNYNPMDSQSDKVYLPFSVRCIGYRGYAHVVVTASRGWSPFYRYRFMRNIYQPWKKLYYNLYKGPSCQRIWAGPYRAFYDRLRSFQRFRFQVCAIAPPHQSVSLGHYFDHVIVTFHIFKYY